MMTSSNGNIFRVTGPLCGEFTGPRDFPAQRLVTRSFAVFFDLRLNNRLSKQPWGWWFERPSWSLWRQCNAEDYFGPKRLTLSTVYYLRRFTLPTCQFSLLIHFVKWSIFLMNEAVLLNWKKPHSPHWYICGLLPSRGCYLCSQFSTIVIYGNSRRHH